MGGKQRVTGKQMGLPAGVALGMGTALLVTLAGAGVLAWLIAGERLAESTMGYGCAAVLLLSSAAGAWTASALVGHQRMAVCLLAGLGYYLLLLGMTALLFDGRYQGLGVTALVVLGGSLGVLLV